MKNEKSGNSVKVAEIIENGSKEQVFELFETKKASYVRLVEMICESGRSLQQQASVLTYCWSEFENSPQAKHLADIPIKEYANQLIKKEIPLREFIHIMDKHIQEVAPDFRGADDHFLTAQPHNPTYSYVSYWGNAFLIRREKIRNFKNKIRQQLNPHNPRINPKRGWVKRNTGLGYEHVYDLEAWRKNAKREWVRSTAKKIAESYPAIFNFNVDFFLMIRLGVPVNCFNDFTETIYPLSFAQINSVFDELKQILQKRTEEKERINREHQKKEREHQKKEREQQEFQKKTGLPGYYFDKFLSIYEFADTRTCPGGYTSFNGWYITANEDQGEDWDAYSKAWHRSHGPKRWIENRRLIISRHGKKSVTLQIGNRWTINEILGTLAAHFNIKPVVPKGRKSVQLNEYLSVKMIRKSGNIEIYERLFGKEHFDYAIYDRSHKLTYHHPQKSRLADGIKAKLEAKAEKEREIIDYGYALSLGFCETGIREFCELNGIDINGKYQRQELRNIILKKRPENCRKFRWELAKLGMNINCK